ncbi:Arc family DNA-binding protein [Citrobacter koseri]|uniref:Arc family DNA-binding protein n=1 Tax=Citrobacter koseri TaxID=545 RepID=UPI000D72BD39|nr:Arc family DNA-binding protein [Citrobacter koseri]PWY09697.1 DNA-binding protein [Citrobacter koseri]
MAERKYKHPQVNLRLPEELKARVIELAEANGRSANAEMVAAIEAWIEKNKHIESIDLSAVVERITVLEAEIRVLKSIYTQERK